MACLPTNDKYINKLNHLLSQAIIQLANFYLEITIIVFFFFNFLFKSSTTNFLEFMFLFKKKI